MIPSMLKLLLLVLFPSMVSAMVIGADSRALVNTPKALPYSAVGLVEGFDGQVCTGVLVGRDLVLTAAHCLMRAQQLIPATHVRFHTHYLYGASVGEMSEVVSFEVDPAAVPNGIQDWAILRLKKPVGDTVGFLPTGTLGANAMHKAILRVPGYDVTHSIAKNYGISLLNNNTRGHGKGFDAQGLIFHDMPTGPGSSGGPLLKEINGAWTVVGITVAEIRRGVQCPVFNKSNCNNVAVPESSWREALSGLTR
jgi:protease YdgD